MFLGVASGWVGAGGGGNTTGGVEAVAAGARVAIERVTRFVCAGCSGVAVDCDDVIGWVDAGGRDEVDDGMGAAIGGAVAVVERVMYLFGTGWSSSSLLLK